MPSVLERGELFRAGVEITEAEADVLRHALHGEPVTPGLLIRVMGDAAQQAIECRSGFALYAAMGEAQSGVVNNLDAVLKFYRGRILDAEEKTNGD